MTTLKDTKLGDRVKIWLSQSLGLSKTRTNFPIEATIIGICTDKEVSDEPLYTLGWTPNAMHPASSTEMTVIVPDELSNETLVKNRLDYGWYDCAYDGDMECEILPPIQTQSVLPGVQSPTVKETKWVDATFKDVKLGDKVKVFLKSNKTRTLALDRTDILIEATVIGLQQKDTEGYDVLLGWKSGEPMPGDTGRNYKAKTHKQMVPDDHKYYPRIIEVSHEVSCQVLQTIEVPIEPPAAANVETQLDEYGRCVLGQEEAEAKKETGSAWIAAAIGAGAVAAGIANAMYKAPSVRVEGSLALPIVEAASEQMKASV